jgi:GNAT superfamily N-acetyltransferase
MIRLVQPASAADWRSARQLIEEYAASLDVNLSFQDLAHELERLPHEYGPPSGAFLVAERDDVNVGCVGVRRFTSDTGEVKRLYVSAAGRGRGVGRLLAEGIIAAAVRLGYVRLVLDTLPSMTAAKNLYLSLGFTPIAPYRFNPVPGTSFQQLTIASAEATGAHPR